MKLLGTGERLFLFDGETELIIFLLTANIKPDKEIRVVDGNNPPRFIRAKDGPFRIFIVNDGKHFCCMYGFYLKTCQF